jgi:hypothetical protein
VTAEILVLRLVHILGGMVWVGSGIFNSFFLLPTLAQAGPAAGQVIAGLQRRRLFTILPIVALLTILSGFRLMWIMSAGFSPGYFASTSGRAYAWSGVAAIVGFLVGVVIARPAAVRVAGLSATLAATTDAATRASLTTTLEALRRRSSIASSPAVALVILAAAGMAVARYLR